MGSVGHVPSTSTLTPGIALPFIAPLQQQPNLQLLLLQILTQLQNLEHGQNQCKRAQMDLNQTTEKYRNAQQRWTELEEDFTKEINSLRQKLSNLPNVQEDLRQCREELKLGQMESEKSALQNEIWNKTLNLAERFVIIVEGKGKSIVPELVSGNQETNTEEQTNIRALEKQIKEKQSRIEQLESEKKTAEQSCQAPNNTKETKTQYPVFRETTLAKLVKYCDNCDITRTLFAAVKANNADVTLALLKNGADPNSVDGGRTPLIWAAEKGDVEVGTVLLKNGANTEARVPADHSKAALHYCSQYGHLEFCRLLLDNGADIDSLENYKQNAIFWSSGSLEVTKLLVERGSNIKIRNSANRNVLENNRVGGSTDVANYLATVQ